MIPYQRNKKRKYLFLEPRVKFKRRICEKKNFNGWNNQVLITFLKHLLRVL